MKNPEEIYNRLKEIIYNLELSYCDYAEIRAEIAEMLGVNKNYSTTGTEKERASQLKRNLWIIY